MRTISLEELKTLNLRAYRSLLNDYRDLSSDQASDADMTPEDLFRLMLTWIEIHTDGTRIAHFYTDPECPYNSGEVYPWDEERGFWDVGADTGEYTCES